PGVTKNWLEDMPVIPKGTSSYVEVVNWLNWLIDPLKKTGDLDKLSENDIISLLNQLINPSPQGVTQPQLQPSLEELSPLERALLRLETEDKDSDIYLRRILSWPAVKPYYNLPFNYNRGAK